MYKDLAKHPWLNRLSVQLEIGNYISAGFKLVCVAVLHLCFSPHKGVGIKHEPGQEVFGSLWDSCSIPPKAFIS